MPIGNETIPPYYTEYESLSWPFGPADVQTPAYAAAQTISVTNRMTLVNLGTITGNSALTITPDANLPAGAILVVKATANANGNNVTFAGSALSPAITGVATKTQTIELIYNGTTFDAVGAAVTLN